MWEEKSFIITLTGPSGCGKSTLIERIMELEERLMLQKIVFRPVLLAKYATRSLRRKEIKDKEDGKVVDVISVDEIPSFCDLIYQTYGKKYGLELDKIRTILKNRQFPVIVINDVRVVEELKSEFPEQVLSLFLFREVPRKEMFLEEANDRGNVMNSETEERFNKAIAIYRTYIENIGLFNRVILNPTRTQESEDYAQIQIENVIRGVLNGKIQLKAKKNGNPKLFIIAGNAASGKDEIIQAVNDMGKLQAIIIPKYTSRKQDEEDSDEMICQYVPDKEIIEKYNIEYRYELQKCDRKYEILKTEAAENNDQLVTISEEEMKEKKEIKKPKERFWLALLQEEEAIKQYLAKRILKEASSEHFLENMNLFEKNFDELCKIYKTDGYHKKGINVDEFLLSNDDIDEQFIVDCIQKEADVEHNICWEKLKLLKYKQIWKLYEKEGYHENGINVRDLKAEFDKKLINEFFEYNDIYIDLEKINRERQEEISEKIKGQILKVTGPAYYLEVDDKGLVMYENNKTLYGFEVCKLPEKNNFYYQQMLEQNKHCVLVASLIDIFDICKPFFDEDVITVFSYSEISSEEFEKKSRAGTVDEKMENFEKEIKKYSEYIADFDHVTIYAESELDRRNGGRTEELIDQIFRLFRFYRSDDKSVI